MSMKTPGLLLVAIFMLGMEGCSAGKEYTYEPSSETPSGPGIFSGNDGVFTIYGEEFADDTEHNLEDAVQTSR
jgi:hypothetical protein